MLWDPFGWPWWVYYLASIPVALVLLFLLWLSIAFGNDTGLVYLASILFCVVWLFDPIISLGGLLVFMIVIEWANSMHRDRSKQKDR